MIPAPTNANALREQGVGGKANINQQVAFSSLSGAPVKRVYPSLNVLPGRVLGVLLSGRSYTHKDSWLELGHARLADSIWKLRNRGWVVHMIEEVVETRDSGRPASIGRYFIDAETIADAGEAGQRYSAEAARREIERRAA